MTKGNTMAQPSGYMNPKAKGNKSTAKPKMTEKKAREVSATAKKVTPKNFGQPSGYKSEKAKGNQSQARSTIKVSQSTIDDIKRLGMKKALELAKMNSKATQAGLVAEYMEGTRRLYGEKRVAKATAPKPKPASTKYSPAPYKPKPKTGGSSSNKAK
jgi:hypothetical protein